MSCRRIVLNLYFIFAINVFCIFVFMTLYLCLDFRIVAYLYTYLYINYILPNEKRNFDWASRESFAQYTVAAMAAMATGVRIKRSISLRLTYRRQTYS